jgi:hypothetical protein
VKANVAVASASRESWYVAPELALALLQAPW